MATFKMFFMGGPFAVYFYGVYSPFLTWTQSSPYLIWLSDFFMPHLSTPESWLLRVLTGGPRYLLYIGLASFAIHAGYLYWMKFVRKDIATRLLYRYVRHPQYSSLAIAGAGLVFHWPRFINLILLFLMLFGYYVLARNEEGEWRENTRGPTVSTRERPRCSIPEGAPAGGCVDCLVVFPRNLGRPVACCSPLGLRSPEAFF